MSTRLVVPIGSTTDAHGVPWAQIAADNGCDGVEVSGSPWCVANDVDGLGICTELPPPPPPPDPNAPTLASIAPVDFQAGIDAVVAAKDIAGIKAGLRTVLQAIQVGT